MRLNVQLSLEMGFMCVQCGCDMIMRGQQDRNPEPTLECPKCGFKVKVIQAPALPVVPGPSGRIPPPRPRRF